MNNEGFIDPYALLPMARHSVAKDELFVGLPALLEDVVEEPIHLVAQPIRHGLLIEGCLDDGHLLQRFCCNGR